jgi:hypothetical protein
MLLTRSAVSCSLAPDRQQTPMRTVSGPAPGRMVMSAIRVRSSRLRSRSVVVGADHSWPKVVTAASSSARGGSGALAAVTVVSAASAAASSWSLASSRASRVRATSRFSGSQARRARSARPAS